MISNSYQQQQQQLNIVFGKAFFVSALLAVATKWAVAFEELQSSKDMLSSYAGDGVFQRVKRQCTACDAASFIAYAPGTNGTGTYTFDWSKLLSTTGPFNWAQNFDTSLPHSISPSLGVNTNLHNSAGCSEVQLMCAGNTNSNQWTYISLVNADGSYSQPYSYGPKIQYLTVTCQASGNSWTYQGQTVIGYICFSGFPPNMTSAAESMPSTTAAPGASQESQDSTGATEIPVVVTASGGGSGKECSKCNPSNFHFYGASPTGQYALNWKQLFATNFDWSGNFDPKEPYGISNWAGPSLGVTPGTNSQGCSTLYLMCQGNITVPWVYISLVYSDGSYSPPVAYGPELEWLTVTCQSPAGSSSPIWTYQSQSSQSVVGYICISGSPPGTVVATNPTGTILYTTPAGSGGGGQNTPTTPPPVSVPTGCCPKGGVWSNWGPPQPAQCATTCGSASSQTQTRQCLSAAWGCKCSGAAKATYACGIAPCQTANSASLTCAVSLTCAKKNPVNGAALHVVNSPAHGGRVCWPQPAFPPTNPPPPKC